MLSDDLIKIAKIVVPYKLDDKLFNCKTKQQAIRYIYNTVSHLITGFFRDDNWSNVMKVFNTIEKTGINFNW